MVNLDNVARAINGQTIAANTATDLDAGGGHVVGIDALGTGVASVTGGVGSDVFFAGSEAKTVDGGTGTDTLAVHGTENADYIRISPDLDGDTHLDIDIDANSAIEVPADGIELDVTNVEDRGQYRRRRRQIGRLRQFCRRRPFRQWCRQRHFGSGAGDDTFLGGADNDIAYTDGRRPRHRRRRHRSDGAICSTSPARARTRISSSRSRRNTMRGSIRTMPARPKSSCPRATDILVEASEIEDIVIHGGGGTDTLTVSGSFTGTSLLDLDHHLRQRRGRRHARPAGRDSAHRVVADGGAEHRHSVIYDFARASVTRHEDLRTNGVTVIGAQHHAHIERLVRSPTSSRNFETFTFSDGTLDLTTVFNQAPDAVDDALSTLVQYDFSGTVSAER